MVAGSALSKVGSVTRFVLLVSWLFYFLWKVNAVSCSA
jgi:hypothetical protein